ncbi:hypothetical protein BGZ65_012983 [Modicella reniformis]|uniref:RNA-dependent RNA polymerase n=1 Tax=Modicella reniformis TaxID=1440133 RepID=A0A9P6J607_9FUNG|nr:hypothetical protein BGZ65_012983 [Modicella reniformis]
MTPQWIRTATRPPEAFSFATPTTPSPTAQRQPSHSGGGHSYSNSREYSNPRVTQYVFPTRLQPRSPSQATQLVQMEETRRLKLERLQGNINNRSKADILRLRVFNFDDKVTALELKKNLEEYGELIDIVIERNDQNRLNAIVVFESRPHNVPGLVRASIGGRMLDMELMELKNDGRVVAKSFELGTKLARNVFCSEFLATSTVEIQLQENRRMLKVTFKRHFNDVPILYHVEMKFQDMDKGCIQVDWLDDHVAILIDLRFPPMYWRYDPKKNDNSTEPSKWSVVSNLRRVVDIPKEGVDFNVKAPADPYPAEPNPKNASAKLGRWTVLRCTITERSALRNLNQFVRKCKEFNLLTEEMPVNVVRAGPLVPETHMKAFQSLSFQVRYVLESALSFNYITEYDLTENVTKILCELDELKACMILEHVVSNRQRVWNFEEYVTQEAAKLSRMPTRPRIVPSQCVFLRKLIVTPTTIHLQLPTIETSNRIIRHFKDMSDFFLRVEFSDEGNNKLWSKDRSNENNAIYNRIFAALNNGIKIGDRQYQFLAFSSSQLRENAAWFFCPQGSQTVDSIHKWMGDFSHIKSIAKYAARMGQCFSSTRAIATLSATEVDVINDIEYDGHNFSDGCGRISQKLAQMIGMELEKEATPAAFQIRLGGSKGVLAYYPSLRGHRVQVRPSMKKFEVAHYVVEVIKTSSPASSYLNRQIIILITALGVPDMVILNLKNKMLQDLKHVETDEMVAIRLLYQNWDDNGTSKMMVTMIRAGFLQNEDPYIKNMLTLFKLQMLEELSKRARIHVPLGAYVLGVCDETGELKEGEIFIQVSSIENPAKRKVITGKCMVVRCPCFHPGDIRIVQAVDRPNLSHLHDVVVFNTKGSRGIPSMCSGGDLDGDDFTVIWDPEIVEKIEEYPPMKYDGQGVLTTDGVTILDIKRFFVQYAVSNNLGVIANAHLALSDQLEGGPYHGKCLHLAQLHSDAVDFPKSGKPAYLSPDLRARWYPDFMEKLPGKTYQSNRVLGRIYRECSRQEPFVPKDYRQSFNKRLLIDGYQDYMEGARKCKAAYDGSVRSLMNQYGVKSDLELVSGFIMGVEIITNKREHDVRKVITSAYAAIKRKFRTDLEKEFYTPETKIVSLSDRPLVEMKAAAWYAVCYQDLEPGQPYTFAWIAWDYICDIASRIRVIQILEEAAGHQALGSGEEEETHESSLASTSNTGDRTDLMRSSQEDMMENALEREREKMTLEKQISNLELLQQYAQPFLMPGLNSRAGAPQTAPIGTPFTEVLELGNHGLTPIGLSRMNASQAAAAASDACDHEETTSETESRPVRNKVTTQSGFVTVEPDVDDATLLGVLGF